MANTAPAAAQNTPPNGTPSLPQVMDPASSSPPAAPVAHPPIITAPVVDESLIRERVEAARREEKEKLYKEQEGLKDQIKELRTKLAEKMSPDEKVQAQLEGLQRQLADATSKLEAQQREAQESKVRYEAETRRLQLHSFMERRLREEKEKGTELLIELVGGSSEQEIETSIQLAAVEYAKLKAQFYSRFQQEHPQSQPTPPAPPPVAVQAVPAAVPLTPAAFPTVPNPASVPTVEPGTSGFSTSVAALTTPDAVRSGAYAQQRDRLLATVRQGPVPPPGAPFANTPRVVAVQPTYIHGDVVQPQGHPTGPVAPTQMMQAPPVPIPISITHPPGSNGLMPPAAMAHGQQLLTQPPAQGPVTLPAAPEGGFDPAAARATAVESARRALVNPAHASRAGVQGPRPASHPEYGGVPNPNASFDAGHPMVRNS